MSDHWCVLNMHSIERTVLLLNRGFEVQKLMLNSELNRYLSLRYFCWCPLSSIICDRHMVRLHYQTALEEVWYVTIAALWLENSVDPRRHISVLRHTYNILYCCMDSLIHEQSKGLHWNSVWEYIGSQLFSSYDKFLVLLCPCSHSLNLWLGHHQVKDKFEQRNLVVCGHPVSRIHPTWH
jgi:hypothetical protein